MSTETPAGENTVLTFDQFWTWLQRHANCILRVATPEVVVFDDDDLHWHMERGDGGLVFVQTVRGKRLLAEVAIRASDVDLVQIAEGEESEFSFDLFLRDEEADSAAYSFVMSHGWEPEASGTSPRWVH